MANNNKLNGEIGNAIEQFVEELSEQMLSAFDSLGGDPDSAVRAARGQPLAWWKLQHQAAAIGAGIVMGGAEGSVPIAGSLLLIVPDIMFLMNQSVRCAWGIGEIKGAVVTRYNARADLAQILALWSEHDLGGRLMAMSKGSVSAINTALGLGASIDHFFDFSDELFQQMEAMGEVNPEDEWAFSLALGNYLVSMEKGGGEIRNVANEIRQGKQSGSFAGGIALKGLGKTAAKITGKAGNKYLAKVAGKISAKIGEKVGGKLLATNIPVAGIALGATVGGLINTMIINGIIGAAERYYGNAR